MTCAPDDAVTWKSQLMAGQVDPAIAARLGTILATIHAEAPGHPASAGHPGRHQPVRRAARRPLLPDHRPRPSRPEPADRCADRRDGPARTTSERSSWATSAPRTSWCIRRADPARLRMCPRRRPGLRPGVLPDPSPAQERSARRRSIAASHPIMPSSPRSFLSILPRSAAHRRHRPEPT